MAERELDETRSEPEKTEANAAPVAHGSGTSAVKTMLAHGDPDPAAIAKVIDAHPGERDSILTLLQTTAGNGFTQRVVSADRQPPPGADRGSSADADKVASLLHRLGIDGPEHSHAETTEMQTTTRAPKPVTDDEIEALSPRLHAMFIDKLTAGIDPTLVAAIKAAGGMVPFMKDMAAGKTIGGVDEAKFEQMWNSSADEAWLKDKFRAVSPSMHEWIPSNEVEAIVEKAKTAPGGASWIDLQNELRSPTNQVIFAPAKSSSVSPEGTLVLRGHVGAIYLNGVMQTVDEAKFHDELRAAFTAAKDIGSAVDMLKAVMVEWMWEGDALPKPLDPNLQDSVKKPIDEKALIADRKQHYDTMSSLFDSLKTKYGGVPHHGHGPKR